MKKKNKYNIRSNIQSFPIKTVDISLENEEINLIDLNDYTMPVFSVDLEKKGFPDQAHQFLKRISGF